MCIRDSLLMCCFIVSSSLRSGREGHAQHWLVWRYRHLHIATGPCILSCDMIGPWTKPYHLGFKRIQLQASRSTSINCELLGRNAAMCRWLAESPWDGCVWQVVCHRRTSDNSGDSDWWHSTEPRYIRWTCLGQEQSLVTCCTPHCVVQITLRVTSLSSKDKINF